MKHPRAHLRPHALPNHTRLDSWKEIAAYLNRDVTTVQRWKTLRGYACPSPPPFKDWLGLCLSSRIGRMGARPKSSRRARQPGRIPLSVHPTASGLASKTPSILSRWRILPPPGGFRSRAANCRNPLVSKGRAFLEEPHFECPISEGDGLRRGGTSRCDIARRAFRSVLVSTATDKTDVWVTQVGSGRVSQPDPQQCAGIGESINSHHWGSRRMVLWSHFGLASKTQLGWGDISVWAVPTLGGQPRPYLEGVAEFDWSRDGSRLAYHTPGPGDPLFVAILVSPSETRTLSPPFTVSAGLHSHFPLCWIVFYLFCPRFSARQTGYLPIRPSGESLEVHLVEWTRNLSSPVQYRSLFISGQRSRWFGAMAL